MAPTLQQSYAYADLLVRFYAQLPDQYMHVPVTPVEIIAYNPSIFLCNHSTRNIGAHSSWLSCSIHVGTSNSPRWDAAAHLATVLYGRARLPKASVNSE